MTLMGHRIARPAESKDEITLGLEHSLLQGRDDGIGEGNRASFIVFRRPVGLIRLEIVQP